MPLAAKKNQRTEKVTPSLIDVEPSPAGEVEEPPAPPKITALVYSYNNAAGLRRCLAALEASDARPVMEILVVDKGSRDESPTLDSEFPNTTFLRLPRNFGNTKALNIAMRTGVGELVFFLCPEIEVAPETISRLVTKLEADPDVTAVCPSIVDSHGKPVEQAYRLPTPQTGADLVPVLLSAPAEPVTVEYATFQAMLARKYFIRGINYLDDRYGEFGADAELCFQIRRAGRKLVIVPDVTVVRDAPVVKRSSGAEALLAADRVHGAAVYLSKHYGFMAGLSYRIGQIFKALFSFRFSLLMSLISGSKVDGSQGVSL